MKPYYEELHEEACKNKENTYKDPLLDKRVLTAYFLKERGYCCYSNCRHCPYENPLTQLRISDKLSS